MTPEEIVRRLRMLAKINARVDVPGEVDALLRAAKIVEAASGAEKALASWVSYMDQLDADSEPGDKLNEARRLYHGKRVEASRAALRALRGDYS